MNSGEFIEKVTKEYNFAKSEGFDSIVIIIETSGGEYEISEHEDGFINDNLDGIYFYIDEIASDVFSLIKLSGDKVKEIRIE